MFMEQIAIFAVFDPIKTMCTMIVQSLEEIVLGGKIRKQDNQGAPTCSTRCGHYYEYFFNKLASVSGKFGTS